MTNTTLTASQLGFQSQYEALKAQQDAYKAQIYTLTNNIRPDQLTPDQTNLLKIAQIKQIDAETQLVNLKTDLHLALTNQINSADATLAGMASTDPARAQVLAYQATLVQAKTELDAVAQSWAIPAPGSTRYTIDGYLYSNNGQSPQPVGLTYVWDSVKNYAVGAVNGAVNVADTLGNWKTDISNWFNTLDPKLQYQVCKNNWENAEKAMGSFLPASLKIPDGLVGKIVDKAIGNANDYAFNTAANVCKGIMPKADLLSLMQNDLGAIPADVMNALDSFGAKLEFTFSPDIAAQLVTESAVSNAVNKALSISTAVPASVLLADASQAYATTMTDWNSNPAAVFNATLADSASSQATLEQTIQHPTGAQTLANAVTAYGPTLIDALSLIKAIQSGNPLPVAASGLRLANALTSTNGVPGNYTLSGAANIGSSILSLMSLDAALQRGDALGIVTAGAQTLSFGTQAYLDFARANQVAVSSSVTEFAGDLSTALPY
ncbi:MAG: hypothetical protein EPN14_10765, partial [Gallionella sp.]